MFCSHCGARLGSGAAFCSACGAATGMREEPVADVVTPVGDVTVLNDWCALQKARVASAERRSNHFKICGAILVLLCLVCGAIWYVAIFTNGTSVLSDNVHGETHIPPAPFLVSAIVLFIAACVCAFLARTPDWVSPRR